MLGDSPEDVGLRGDVLALLLSGSLEDDAWLLLAAEGEAGRAGRGGNDLVEPSPVVGVGAFGKMAGVENDAELSAVRDIEVDCGPDGVLLEALGDALPFDVLARCCELGETVVSIEGAVVRSRGLCFNDRLV